jgi:SAM-dependent methyltransferase
MNFLKKTLVRYLDHIYQDTVYLRYRMQRTTMEPDPDALFLDVGCQTGVNTARLAEALGTAEVVGLDYNARTLREAGEQGVRQVVGDANRPLPFSEETFDVVSAIDVIEHLVDPRMLVREAWRILKPGGYVIFATPNLASWHNIFALLVGLQPFSGPNLTTMLDADVDVVRSLHRQAYGLPEEGEVAWHGEEELHRHIVVVAFRAMVKLMHKEGFRVEAARGFGYYPFPKLLARPLARIDPLHAHHMVVKGRKPT